MESARRARGAVTAVFVLNGFLFGTWAARIPAIRDRAGLSDGEQGVVFAFISIGAIVSMPIAGALAARLGSRIPTRVSIALSCLGLVIVALPTSVLPLCAAGIVMGLAWGALDVTMNAHGVAVEGRYGRPILASFHAGFSGGGLVGGALGAVAASADVDVRVNFLAVAVASFVVGMLWSRRFLPSSEDSTPSGEAVFARPPRKLWALGALAFAGLIIEGASADWSAVYLDEHLGTSAATGALAFTAFSVTMTVGRVFGDRLVRRFGEVAMVRCGGALAAVAFAAALLSDSPAGAIAGFACLGAGMSPVVPIIFRAASHAPGIRPGLALAAVSSTGYFGFIVGPTLIGGLAELLGLPNSLVLIVALASVVALLAPATRVRRPASA